MNVDLRDQTKESGEDGSWKQSKGMWRRKLESNTRGLSQTTWKKQSLRVNQGKCKRWKLKPERTDYGCERLNQGKWRRRKLKTEPKKMEEMEAKTWGNRICDCERD